jgi:pilus assembly protein CpaF
MSTGHDGSMGTLHANTPREALSRLESMITICGYQLPNKTVREMIASAVDVIIHIQRLRDGSRRLTHITEVLGMEGEVIVTQDIVILDIEGEDSFGNLIAKHRGTGIGQPKFWERARMFNKEFELQSVLAQLEVAHGVV